MAHQYAPTASTVNFEYTLAPGVTPGSGIAIALKPGGTAPAPPTGLGVTVH